MKNLRLEGMCSIVKKAEDDENINDSAMPELACFNDAQQSSSIYETDRSYKKTGSGVDKSYSDIDPMR